MKAALAGCGIALLLAGCATGGPKPHYWKLVACAEAARPGVRFLREDKSEIATVPRAACQRLDAAAARIQRQAGLTLDQVLISDRPEVNASATRDRMSRPVVIVTMGMLKALGADEDAWAGLLGHEVAHLAMRHGETRRGAKDKAQASGQVVGTVIGQLVPGVGGLVAGNAANFATTNAFYGAYTRPQEAEADATGLQWMVAAGYDPHGMERLFEVLGSQPGLPAFLSTHPGAEDRAQSVRDFIARQKRGD